MYFGHELDTNETDYLDNKVNNGGDVGCILSFKVVVDGVQTKRFINCACPVLGCDGGGSRTRYAMKQQGLTEFTEALLGAERFIYKRAANLAEICVVEAGHMGTRRFYSLVGQDQCRMDCTSGLEVATC